MPGGIVRELNKMEIICFMGSITAAKMNKDKRERLPKLNMELPAISQAFGEVKQLNSERINRNHRLPSTSASIAAAFSAAEQMLEIYQDVMNTNQFDFANDVDELRRQYYPSVISKKLRRRYTVSTTNTLPKAHTQPLNDDEAEVWGNYIFDGLDEYMLARNYEYLIVVDPSSEYHTNHLEGDSMAFYVYNTMMLPEMCHEVETFLNKRQKFLFGRITKTMAQAKAALIKALANRGMRYRAGEDFKNWLTRAVLAAIEVLDGSILRDSRSNEIVEPMIRTTVHDITFAIYI
jgi:hypothetical protein